MKQKYLKLMVLLVILTLVVSCGKNNESSTEDSSHASSKQESQVKGESSDESISEDKVVEGSSSDRSESKNDASNSSTSQNSENNSSSGNNSSNNSSSSHNSNSSNNSSYGPPTYNGPDESEPEKLPWEDGGKQPKDYTWREYEELTESQKEAFQETFDSSKEFTMWKNQALNKLGIYPWLLEDKQPSDYTWEEYELLTSSQRLALQLWFDTTEAFDAWMDQAMRTAANAPWENGGKQPSEYTWKEYEALNSLQRLVFQRTFDSIESFEEWKERAQQQPVHYPWNDAGAKQPKDYTWSEFEALTTEQQMAFQNTFASVDEFDAWLQKVHPDNSSTTETKNPWDEAGAKQPADYTWAEYEVLTPAQQMAFQNSFVDQVAFDAWLQKVQGSEEDVTYDNSWDAPGAKQPKDYTWAEFEALTAAQQMAFQNSFASFEAFDAWLQKNQPSDVVVTDNPWDAPGAKQPKDYTMAEFEALTPGQQMAFQNSFVSFEEFDAWLQKAQGSSEDASGESNPWDAPNAKQPQDYTWAEFEGLTAAQQMAFQNSFASIDEFDAWLQKAQSSAGDSSDTEANPWGTPGAKQPKDYTWAEFEALTPGQQIAFQFAFDTEDGFDKWLAENEPE